MQYIHINNNKGALTFATKYHSKLITHKQRLSPKILWQTLLKEQAPDLQ